MNRLRTLGVVVAGLAWLPAGMDCAYAADGEEKADGLATLDLKKRFHTKLISHSTKSHLAKKAKLEKVLQLRIRIEKALPDLFRVAGNVEPLRK